MKTFTNRFQQQGQSARRNLLAILAAPRAFWRAAAIPKRAASTGPLEGGSARDQL